jgi:alpha-L-rhamnosidase
VAGHSSRRADQALAHRVTDERPWAGSWIWPQPEAEQHRPLTVAALRSVVNWDPVPTYAPARVVAVARYALLVNGAEVARGPARSQGWRVQVDEVDIAPWLQPGRNHIAAQVWTYGQPMPWWSPPGPLQAGFLLDLAYGEHVWGTSAMWEGRLLPGWSMKAPTSRITGRGDTAFDLRELAADWAVTAGDWPAAAVVSSALPGVSPRGTPPTPPLHLTARRLSLPSHTVRSLDQVTDGWVAGEVLSGTLRLEVTGPEGASVTVRVAERGTPTQPQPTADETGFRIVCDGTDRTVETLDSCGLSGLSTAVDDDVVVRRVAVIERLHPVGGGPFFDCADPDLTRVWSVGRRTVTLCSHDAYIDCPTREQRAWTGDAVVHQMVDLTTSTDWTLAVHNTVLSAAPRPDGLLPMAVAGDLESGDFTIADWSLHWVHAVWNLHRWVGDEVLVAALLPVVEGVVRWFARHLGPAGLPQDLPQGALVDWASIYTDGPSAAVSGLWGRALVEYAEMAAWLGDDGRETWARTQHARLRVAFDALWDPPRHRYRDVLDGVRRAPVASQHGQAAAIVGGLVPPDRVPLLVPWLLPGEHLVDATFSAPHGPAAPLSEVEVGGGWIRTGPPEPWWDPALLVRAQPFFRYVVHDAVVAAGAANSIPNLCRDWLVLLDRCSSSWSETWYGGTTCHGWSSTPTRDLMTAVLGVTPASPGFNTARVEPSLGELSWARGAVPTPHGLVHVDVTTDQVSITSPVPVQHGDRLLPAGQHRLTR